MEPTWYCLEIEDERIILNSFPPFFKAAGMPHDMAVFSKYDHRRNRVTVYFTPSAREFAEQFQAIPCEKPSRGTLLNDPLVLLVGDDRAWEIHYPGSTAELE